MLKYNSSKVINISEIYSFLFCFELAWEPLSFLNTSQVQVALSLCVTTLWKMVMYSMTVLPIIVADPRLIIIIIWKDQDRAEKLE